MPRIRAEQLQGLTLTDAQISDGQLYDATGAVLEEFDPMRLIDQSKVRGLDYQPNGWISRGIINKVEVLPEWQADFEGRLFYVNTSDELYLAVGTEPWYILISGNTASGWDAELTVRMGTDGMNWNGSIATQFQTQSYTFSPDGSDLFVYLNGSLQRLDHDFELIDQRTIRMLRNIEEFDTVTLLVILSNSMLNYATKAWVFEQIQSGGLQHSLDAAYDDGSIISVDNRNVDWRLQTDNKFIISEAATGVPTAASHLGTEDLSSGHNWQNRWQSFDITVRNGGNILGPARVFLNSPTLTTEEAATEVSEALVTAGVTDLYGYVDNNNIGIQSTAVGSDISFDIESGTNALDVFGLEAASAVGDDAYSSYHEFGLSVDGQSSSGLEDNEKFWFSVNGTQYSVSTGLGTTYDQLRSSLDTVLDSAGFTVTTEGASPNQDIRVTNDTAGYSHPTQLAGVSFAGAIEITQVTTTADTDRSLDGAYFTLESIDSALFGHPKPYYVWYHMDAEAEVTRITTTAENSDVTLADSYFSLHDVSNDYFVWYEVETPQTAGYQELGFTGLDSATSTGLTQDTSYDVFVSINGASNQTVTITTPPDIQPTAEVTEVTTPADSSQSLSGTHWTLNAQSGTGYYVWYNIDTPAGEEITEITAVADSSQSLSGKSFSIFTPSQQYYAWLRMMTDPGQPQEAETTEVTTVGDTSQSLSGKYFTLSSANGSQYYVWYEMETDPGSAAVSEITEVTTVADSGQSLSGTYFGVSTPATDYYVWYRMMTEGPISGVPEITNATMPSDSNKSLSGKYWTFNTPYNDYYVWYRMEEVAAVQATAQETEFTFTSNTASDYVDTQTATFYNFNDAYTLWFNNLDVEGITAPAVSNPVEVIISTSDTATEIATAVMNAVNAASIPFSATNPSNGVARIINDNAGEQTNPPSGDTDITATVVVDGTDYVAAQYSTNPSPAGRTGVQVNILENDSNVDVATKTESQLALLGDISTSRNSATITITNDDNGAVDDAADVDAGVAVTVTQQGVTSQPAQYSTDPSPSGRTGIVVNISEDETADDVASLTAGVLNSMAQFSSSATSDVITIENATAGAAEDAIVGDSGFAINTTQQGQDYVAPTYSTDPAPSGRSSLKVSITENADASTVAEATRAIIDASPAFVATRSNAVVTITDQTAGPVADAADVDTTFTINITQQGQDYIAPTYTSNPGGTGTAIQVDIVENDTAASVATAIESAFNGTTGFSATRVGEVVTITNDAAGDANDAVDIDTGFTISVSQQGYEAYSSTNPAVIGRTGIQVNIVENDTAGAVASKTQTAINNNANFAATASGSKVTIIDENGGAVADAADVDAGVIIDVTNQGTNLIPADVSWDEILTLLNSATSGAEWTLSSGDVRLTSDTIGSWSSIEFDTSATGSNALFLSNLSGYTSVDSPVAGTSSYSAQPTGTGTPIKVAVRRNATASTVASATQAAIDAIEDFDAVVGTTSGVDTHIVTVTNVNTGVAADATDNGTGFTLLVQNQGADESTDPSIAGKTGIQVSIAKNDTANAVATKTQAAVDVGGEFYVTRLDNVISIQNDHPGVVDQTADVDTDFAFTRTGTGQDVKYSLFGSNGLDITLPSATDGIDAVPADTGIGTETLTGGYNFYTFPKDFAAVINSEPVVEIFLDEAVYNSSEMVSHINTRIADAGVTNLEAYQFNGRIGFRTVQTGLDQTLEIQDSLSDALVTLGWTAGTYAGDFGSADSIFEVNALTGTNEVVVKADVLPAEHGVYNIGADGNKFKSLHVQEIHVDTGTIYFDESDVEFSIGLGQRNIKDSDGTSFPADSRTWEANDIRFYRENGKEYFLTAGDTTKQVDNPNEYVVPAQQSNSGASKIGVRGLIGIIPKYDLDGNENTLNQTGWDSDLQTMMEALALQAGGSCKNFDDFNIWRTEKTGVDEITGEGDANARGFFKNRTQIYVRDLEREIRLLKYDAQEDPTNGETPVSPGFIGPGQWNSGESYDQWDWDWLWGRNRPLRGEDFHVTLEPLDANGLPTTGSLLDDSIKLSTTGGIVLETAADKEVHITNDLRIDGDLIVEGDTVTLNTSTLEVEDVDILLAKNTTTGVNAGITVERGTSGSDARIKWDDSNGDIWRAGLVGSEKAIALRDDEQVDDGVALWNNSTASYETSSSLKFNGTTLNVAGNIMGPNGAAGSYVDGFEKVYNAVWNDIADFLPLDEKIEVEYGKVYVRTVDGQTRKSTSYNEQGIIGLASDTYGFGVGRKENWNGTQLPVAIGGFVLAHVIAEYAPGTPLTCGEDGVLVEMRIEEKRDYPERMVATYYKPESVDEWNGVAVNGRHWVKVKG